MGGSVDVVAVGRHMAQSDIRKFRKKQFLIPAAVSISWRNETRRSLVQRGGDGETAKAQAVAGEAVCQVVVESGSSAARLRTITTHFEQHDNERTQDSIRLPSRLRGSSQV